MAPTLESLRVLIVDDVAGERAIIRDMLNEIGFRDFTEADGGDAALRLIEKEAFQLVISDLKMPNVTGKDILSKIRKDANMCMVPFVMVTAQTDAIPIRAALAPNRTAWLYKPLAYDAFKATVLQLMKRWYQIDPPAVQN